MAKYDKNGYIMELEKDEVFVFGSNGHGAHLGGAAATAGHCVGVTNAIMGALEPNTNFADFKQKETPPHYTTKEELETRRKKLAEMRKLFESKKNKSK